ncbi:hypothetical protein B0T13DRAFT_512017 [Neurospora crassa]|nr:hypothetical protein B0T13DRAFT_512017 [Neurospora crassa]
MDNTNDKQPDSPNSIPLLAVVTKGEVIPQPDVPQERRMTRGMMAAGRTIPPVAAPVKRKARAPKPIMVKKEKPNVLDETSSQGTASLKKTKAPPLDPTDPWACGPDGVPVIDRIVCHLTMGYARTPREDEISEAAHKFKGRAIKRHSLRDIKTIANTKKHQARKKLAENPGDKLQQIKLDLLNVITAHITSEYSDAMYAKWREGREKVRMNEEKVEGQTELI